MYTCITQYTLNAAFYILTIHLWPHRCAEPHLPSHEGGDIDHCPLLRQVSVARPTRRKPGRQAYDTVSPTFNPTVERPALSGTPGSGQWLGGGAVGGAVGGVNMGT